MKNSNPMWSSAMAGVLCITFALSAMAQENPSTEIAAKKVAINANIIVDLPFAVHDKLHEDPGVYARGIYIAYALTPDEKANTLVKNGLTNFANTIAKQGSLVLDGIVAIDLENISADALAFLPIIYVPVIQQTQLLSRDAGNKIQNHATNGGKFIVNAINGLKMNSDIYRGLVKEMGVGRVERVGKDHAITKSFHLFDDLSTIAHQREVYVEDISEAQERYRSSSFVLSDQNWPLALAGATGPDLVEDTIAAVMNTSYWAIMGEYGKDAIRQPYVIERRGFQEDQNRKINGLPPLGKDVAPAPDPMPDVMQPD